MNNLHWFFILLHFNHDCVCLCVQIYPVSIHSMIPLISHRNKLAKLVPMISQRFRNKLASILHRIDFAAILSGVQLLLGLIKTSRLERNVNVQSHDFGHLGPTLEQLSSGSTNKNTTKFNPCKHLRPLLHCVCNLLSSVCNGGLNSW